MSEQQHDRAKPYNEELRAKLDAYRNSFDPPLTNRQLAKELNSNATAVSKYLHCRPEGDVAKLEATVEDVLANAARRRDVETTLVKTSVSRQVNSLCETIRKTGDIGLIHSAAGQGKTIGMQLYLRDNPSAIGITLTAWSRTASEIFDLLWEAVETRRWPGNVRRSHWLAERLKGSRRILLVDNAQRITESGRQYLFDFHDATGMPLMLLGNPEVLRGIRRNDQQFSRVGIVQEAKLTDGRALAEHLVDQLCPEGKDTIMDLAVKVIANQGYARALKKHLLLIPEVLSACKGDYRTAFLAAHTQLVNDYKL